MTEPLARFSLCRRYRYTLTREVEPLTGTRDRLLFIMLNPSTADETEAPCLT